MRSGRILALLALVAILATSGFGFIDTTSAAGPTRRAVTWGRDQASLIGNLTGTTGAAFVPVPTNISDFTAIAAGATHALGLRSDGTVWAWGSNLYGQLGVGNTPLSGCGTSSTYPCTLTPVQIVGGSGTGALSGIVAIAAGDAHSVAIRGSDGAVFSWGANYSGQLGKGGFSSMTSANDAVPALVVEPAGAGVLKGIVRLAAGYEHTLALKSDGTVWAWGANDFGQLGSAKNTAWNSIMGVTIVETCGSTPCYVRPVQVDSLSGATSAIAAGSKHSLAVRQSDGAAFAWGWNDYSQLGDGGTAPTWNPVRVRELNSKAFLTGVTSIAAGGLHSVALKSDQTLWAWGANDSGQLGAATVFMCPPLSLSKRCSGAAVQVFDFDASGMPAKWVEEIAAGTAHTMVRTKDSAVRAWGRNDLGQLGAPSLGSSSQSGLQVIGANGSGALTGARAIASGGDSSLALVEPLADASPKSLSFGNQTFGSTSAAETVTLTNTGSVDLSIASVTVSGNFARVNASSPGACASSLGPGKTCSVDIAFVPQGPYGPGPRSGTLTINHDGASGPSSIVLTGKAIGVPVATPAANSVAFGKVRVGTTGVASVKLTNTGTDVLTYGLSLSNQSAFGFRSPPLPDQCGASSTALTLAVGQSCTIHLTLSPTTVGPHSAQLSVTGAPVTAVAQLDGTAVEPRASVSPNALYFATTAVGQTTAPQTTTLSSIGSMDALILDFARILGPNAADFVIERDPSCSPKPPTFAPGAPLEPNAVCTTWVRFAPSAAGSRTAKLVYALDAAGGPHEVALGGTGVTPPLAAVADLSPSIWDFGAQVVGTNSRIDVTLTNVGTGSMNVKDVSLSYTSGSQGFSKLSDACSGSSLPAGVQCVVTVAFEPDDASYRSGVLDFAHSASSGPHIVQLGGKGD